MVGGKEEERKRKRSSLVGASNTDSTSMPTEEARKGKAEEKHLSPSFSLFPLLRVDDGGIPPRPSPLTLPCFMPTVPRYLSHSNVAFFPPLLPPSRKTCLFLLPLRVVTLLSYFSPPTIGEGKASSSFSVLVIAGVGVMERCCLCCCHQTWLCWRQPTGMIMILLLLVPIFAKNFLTFPFPLSKKKRVSYLATQLAAYYT